MHRIRGRLTYANVIATLALFIALGGASYAAVKLPKNSVGTKQLKNGAVTGAKLKNGSVTGAKIAPGSIGGADVDSGSLGTVPNASHAASANTAGSATTAGHASTADRAATAERAEAVPAPEALHVVTNFEPGCSANATENLGPVGFYKDAFGEVHLVGSTFCTAEDTDAFVLPPGFRPATEILQPTAGDVGKEAEILVLPSGVVRAFDSKSATLFGVSFRTN
jgi:hypothetical protein